MKKTAILFFSISLVLTAASGIFAQKRLLADTSWKLVEAGGRSVTNTSASIEFDRRADDMTGNTGCNSMSGSVDIRGKNIDFGAVVTTKRMCKLMPGNVAEHVVLKGLENARRFEVRGDSLRLYDRRGRTLLKFKQGSTDDDGDAASLDGRKWVLEQIKGRQTFVALPYAFLNFDSRKMSAGGDTSCNVFGGSYSVEGSAIKFSDLISTMRACVEDDAKMSVERDFLEGMRRANRYVIRDGRLHLYRNNEILLSFRGEKK